MISLRGLLTTERVRRAADWVRLKPHCSWGNIVRIWGHGLIGGLVVLGSPLGMTGAAGATRATRARFDTCPEVLAGTPAGAVEKRTDPDGRPDEHR